MRSDPENPKSGAQVGQENVVNDVSSTAATRKGLQIAGVVAFYFAISLCIVIVNKTLLSENTFPYPLVLTWIQFVIAFVIIIVTGLMGQLYVYFVIILCFLVYTSASSFVDAFSQNISRRGKYREVFYGALTILSLGPPFTIFPPFEFDFAIALKVAPLTVVYVSMILFNNLCLQWVEVTFYQVARANTIFFAITFTYIILGKTTKWLSVCACIVVVSGFAVGSMGEVKFEWYGLIFGVLSSAFVALYGIFVKKVIDAVGKNHWRLLIYNTLMAIILLFVVLLFTGGVNVLLDPETWPDSKTQGQIFLSGVFGWLINIAIFMQINYTSALTNSISGTAKACVQTLLGWLLWRNPVSTMNFIGIMLVIGGSAWYSRIRYMSMLEEKARQRAQEQQGGQ